MNNFQFLTDFQWQILEPLFPNPIKRKRGKPHAAWRTVINSILYVLLNEMKWEALPKSPEYASKSVSHRWYKNWKSNGLLDQILTKLKEASIIESEIKFPKTRVRLPKKVIESVIEPRVVKQTQIHY